MTFKEQMHAAAREIISRALDDCGGSVLKAAKLLGLNRAGMYKMIKLYDVPMVYRPSYSVHDRYLWRELHAVGLSARKIAAKFECGHSTVGRELSKAQCPS